VVKEEEYITFIEYTFSLKMHKMAEDLIVEKNLKDLVTLIRKESVKTIENVFDWFKNVLRYFESHYSKFIPRYYGV